MPSIMMAPGKPTKTIEYSKFRGVDFSSNPREVAEYRSPDALNMVSDKTFRPVKRFGYEMIAKTPGNRRINGIHKLVSTNGATIIVHAGNNLYKWNPNAEKARVFSFKDISFKNMTFNSDPFNPNKRAGMDLIYSNMNDRRSMSFQIEGKLWLVDGKMLLCWDGTTIKTAASIAYIPTTIISSPPQGGGETYEARNMLTPQTINSFVVSKGQEAEKQFQLDTRNYDSIVEVRVLQADGSWVPAAFDPPTDTQKKEGIVILTLAPGVTPIEGKDNVKITLSKSIPDSIEKINGCTCGVLWGIGGNNRMFISGNPKFPNLDFASNISTATYPAPTYFPDSSYSYVGQDASAIVGYMRIGENLAILKESNDQDATIYIRKGTLNEKMEPEFSIREGIAGVGALTPFCMNSLRDDPVFLSEQGVFALTSNVITNERYAQPRGDLISKRLLTEPDLTNAVAIEHHGMLHIAVNGNVYVADAAQPTKNDGRTTGEQYQYEWYFWNNIPARVWFKHENKLWFGTNNGEIFRFYNTTISASYNDNGKAIRAYWTTPNITFGDYSVYKTIRRIYSYIKPSARSSVKVWLKENGAFELVDDKKVDVFDFNDVDFRRFTFNLDSDVGVIATKVKAKRIITTQVKLENNILNEAFGITGIMLYYDIKNKVR